MMKRFDRLSAFAAPLAVENVDTDCIVPGRFLSTISRDGLGEALFWTLRQDPAFILNKAPWNAAGILIALDNFGCGSSREHAPWALLDYGFRCIIAPSIADIFYNNCFKNGILPITLSGDTVHRLLRIASQPTTAQMMIDLPTQTIVVEGEAPIKFDIEASRKRDLLEGVDEIDRTLGFVREIGALEQRQRVCRPWLTRQACTHSA